MSDANAEAFEDLNGASDRRPRRSGLSERVEHAVPRGTQVN